MYQSCSSSLWAKGCRLARQGRGLTITSTQPAPGQPFHLAIPVHDMRLARNFYGGVLGLEEGRRDDEKWQDYSIGGHQLVCHYVGKEYRGSDYWNPVDKDDVPVPHFGLALPSREQFDLLAKRLVAHNVKFIIPPTLRFAGKPGEQMTMFFKDPSNNNLEFKTMTNHSYLFKRYNINSV